jgi:hypothetical protein
MLGKLISSGFVVTGAHMFWYRRNDNYGKPKLGERPLLTFKSRINIFEV